MAVTYVRRDPFARGSYLRETAGSGNCFWCGKQCNTLFRYVWESDARRGWISNAALTRFCNFECFRSYHS